MGYLEIVVTKWTSWNSSGRVPSVTSNDDNAFLEWTQARYITVVLSVHDRLRACI